MGMRVTGIGLYIQIERQPQSRPLVLRSMLLMGTPSRALSYRARGNRNGKCAFELISITVNSISFTISTCGCVINRYFLL